MEVCLPLFIVLKTLGGQGNLVTKLGQAWVDVERLGTELEELWMSMLLYVTTSMTAILKQFQATPPPATVKAIEEICVTCGGAHLYYQCLAADGNTFLEFWDNI
ncbi:hypothetical protein Tco_0924319 [Tanacetum coccineum]|uniref:Uncharacterized protein n=1 Tax=Tanacetum coccineum TaxID=301880 RepID=A0ABQ5D3K3_9ASTR